MIRRTLKEIEQMALGNGLDIKFYDIDVQGISIDSRTIAPGNMFVPIVRDKDGHDYIKEAIQNGAIAAFWQNDHPYPPCDIPLIFFDDCLIALQLLAKSYRNQLSIKVVAITGSNGKTTTKDMVTSILETTYRVHKTKGNLNSQIGLPLTLLEIQEHTEVAVLEMGMSERGQIERLSQIAEPDIAVITMIGLSHLGSLGSREEIAAAKLEISKGLKSNGVLILNGDEPLLKVDFNRIIHFGANDSNDYFVNSIKQEPEKTLFLTNQSTKQYCIPMIGKHNVLNALASIVVSEQLLVSEELIKRGLEELKMTGMRMEQVKSKDGFTLINDAWNASPVSMIAAIETFEALVGYSRKFLILGDMLELGDREKDFHKEIGQMIDPSKIDYVFTIGDLGKEIAVEAKKKFKDDSRVKAFQDKNAVTQEIRSLASPQDVILVKGSRGMKLEEIVLELS
ncbi:UDP-N-acetylmuramoyl-tripeptide--D-alanyl-D-alanine ligase [Paenibacillus sp. V4I9]|uniref:UDP-N-acetylmuramoyl-tripeptide--D-alanyl-D- alanine ligase n=1 Tax=Paenibacillus sp. V4I9 TaxID=3042308 RepID=UPI0027853DB8|nr:UDP-N-acetylmuramoyl-tripeptide--D-alanyl-D-alanine ligase [Paenibacillus sp. V4I9]MDQ0888919.1 UDP-N-acetylmuramoyl-tripeptide--D-alanyl-D-alanine ligase [Paenibacillus sp. V4I9]